MPDERIVTFPWGVDLSHFSPTPVQTEGPVFTLLSTRSWEPIYGVDVIARAFVLAARQLNGAYASPLHHTGGTLAEPTSGAPLLRLIMLGNGSQAAELRQIFIQGGVEDQVLFPGQVSQSDLPHSYRMADLYVAASHSDGTSISLLEAMACGRPVLVSDIPGNREWVTPGEQGWLFRPGDPHALAEGILQAVARRSELAALGQTARQTAEARADWDKNFQGLLDAYELAVSGS
jgi:glycosyltransferase involved in cell wall biosynthesis